MRRWLRFAVACGQAGLKEVAPPSKPSTWPIYALMLSSTLPSLWIGGAFPIGVWLLSFLCAVLAFYYLIGWRWLKGEFIYAVRTGDLQQAEHLWQRGLNLTPTIKNADGQRVSLLRQSRSAPMTQWLLDRGVSCREGTPGCWALHDACTGDAAPLVLVLLKAGASRTLRDSLGHTARERARLYGCHEAVAAWQAFEASEAMRTLDGALVQPLSP